MAINVSVRKCKNYGKIWETLEKKKEIKSFRIRELKRSETGQIFFWSTKKNEK